MKRFLVTTLLTATLIFSSTSIALAAPPEGKGPPEFDKIVFVHYPKGTAPAKPPNAGGGEGGYKYSKYHWAALPVTYYVDLTEKPAALTSELAMAGIIDGFQTWEDDPGSDMDFDFDNVTTLGISSLNNTRDGVNVVGWADISSQYPQAIAVTIYWYNVATKLVSEVDMALNTNGYTWWQHAAGDQTWDYGDTTDSYDVDVQNIVTHEAGHWLVLADLYNATNSEQTMYGYSAEFELKKRSLNSGDIAGIRKIY